MSKKFAILKVQRVKDWRSLARRVNHCERVGKKLPANVHADRQHLNERIFPDAYGPAAAIVRWHQRMAGRPSPDILAAEIRNLPLLVSTLNNRKNPVAAHIKSLLPESTRAILGSYKRSVTPLEPVRNELVEQLKAVVLGPSIYERKRFKKVRLRDVTRQLLNSNPQGEAVQMLNRLLLEDAFPGALNALVKPRDNAVLAVEVLMAVSHDANLTPAKIVEWKAANLTWLRARYGAENVIAGAANGDETTPHLHAVILPMDHENRLNCKDVLGDRKAMRELQDHYWQAMKSFGLNRGLRGSKRQYIPQQELYEHRISVKKDVETVKSSLQAQLDRLQAMDSAAWQVNREEIIAGIKQTMGAAQSKLVEMAGMAEEVLLARRDERERIVVVAQNEATDDIVAVARLASDKIVAEKTMEAKIVAQRAEDSIFEAKKATDAIVAQAKAEAEAVKTAATTTVIEAQKEASDTVSKVKKEVQIVTQRADAVLKQHAALVRGLDLVPIAKDILALEPVEKDGVFTFTSEKNSLQITGRKFEDAKNSQCKGTGAIDLVKSLTNWNFKDAVEYLIPRVLPAVIEADVAGEVSEQTKAEVAAIKDLQPRALTLDDIPHIWTPASNVWDKLRGKLVSNYKFAEKTLNSFKERGILWHVSDSTLAVGRVDLNDESETKTLRGVTLLDIDAPVLMPRILVPAKGGVLRLDNGLANVETIVGVANPLEAIAYYEIARLDRKEKIRLAPQEPPPKFPMIISLDAEFPNPPLFERLKKLGKQFVLATNISLRNNALAEKAPMLYGADGKFLKWVTMESADDYLTQTTPELAWTKLMPLKIQEAIARNQNKQY